MLVRFVLCICLWLGLTQAYVLQPKLSGYNRFIGQSPVNKDRKTSNDLIRLHVDAHGMGGSEFDKKAFVGGCAKLAGTAKALGVPDGMKLRTLPNSDITVSEICLGTMMFGEQLTKEAAFEQMDTATKELGINFFDTAEYFPLPSTPSTAGRSEKIIGDWFKNHASGKAKARESVVISLKVCGFGDEMTWLRKDGKGTRVNREQIIEAVDSALKRLNTDYIDILMIGWPDRYVPMYGSDAFNFAMDRDGSTPFTVLLETMKELIKAGKIRSYGVANETPFGITSLHTHAKLLSMPMPVCLQSPYNLLIRNSFENGLEEACAPDRTSMPVIAYAPLAGGALSGKYIPPPVVPSLSPSSSSRLSPHLTEGRLRKYPGFQHRYLSEPAENAIKDYLGVARTMSLPLAPLALAWVYTRPFVTSTVIGASTIKQLKENVQALNIPISQEAHTLFNNVYKKHLDPTRGVFDVVDPSLKTIDPSKLPWGAKDEDVDPELDVLIAQRMGKL